MKKVFRHDFRRETQEIINSLKMSDEQIADKLQISTRSISRWRSGQNSPHASQYQRLKNLISGKPLSPDNTNSGGTTMSKDALDAEYKGKLENLYGLYPEFRPPKLNGNGGNGNGMEYGGLTKRVADAISKVQEPFTARMVITKLTEEDPTISAAFPNLNTAVSNAINRSIDKTIVLISKRSGSNPATYKRKS